MEIVRFEGDVYKLVKSPGVHGCTNCVFSYNAINNCIVIEEMDNKGTNRYIVANDIVKLCEYGIKRYDKLELNERKVLSYAR